MDYGKITNKMILCVDDEPIVLATRKMVLQSAGYHVVTAASGTEGLSEFALQHFNAVVLDFAMPGMDGGRVAAEMKRRNPDIPILMMSAYIFLPEGVTAHVDACLAKTDGPAAMLATLKLLLHDNGMKQGAA